MISRDLKQVALRAGKTQAWLSSRLHGRSPIYADDIYLLAKGLQRDPCDFFQRDTEPTPIPSREDREHTPLRLGGDPPQPNPDALTKDWADRLLSLPPRDVQLLVDFLEHYHGAK